MHVPEKFAETRIEVLHELIRSHPFASIVTLSDSELKVNNMPFFLREEGGEDKQGTLCGHVARTNSIWQEFSTSIESAVIFQGPDSYISPNWYPSKHVHGKAVPTWNYAVVHVYGIPKIIQEPDWLRAHLTELTNQQESSQALPWKLEDAPEEYIERMLKAIVGIEIPITRIVGKWKINQNRQEADRIGVVAGLRSINDDKSKAMADLVLDTVI